MGNVQASSAPPAEFHFTPNTTVNPGTIEEIHKKCKDVFPINFEGAKFSVQKGLSNHFQVSHSLSLSSLTPSGYKFGATYVGTQQYGPGEAYPVLVGEVDPDGNLNANIFHKFTDSLIAKIQAQAQNGSFASNSVLDFKGSNYTASLTVCNPDPIGLSGVLVGHYLQNVYKNIDLGVEMAYQRSPQIPGNQIAVTSLYGKYTGLDYVASASVGLGALHLCYYQKASEQLRIGVEFETSARIHEAVTTIGYQVDLPKADLVFKGMVDSSWNVGATLEKKLLPLPFSLVLSGMLNHPKNQFRLGFNFVVG